MGNYETDYTIESFGAGIIDLEIPADVSIYLLEIDVSNTKYAKYFEVVVLGDGDILYAGDLLDEFIQILFNSKKNPIREISIIIRPSKKLEIETTKWFVFNDEIKFTVNGFYKTSIIEIDDEDNFDDESFRTDWG
tara:strand:- start:980 stop:1384 length:405 start_codon:yes stop_codon:yes gene_type:complete